METLSGTVSGLQHTTRHSQVQERGEVAKTTHLTEFRLGARVVRHTGSLKVALNEGDHVLVAGRPGADALAAEAIRNLSTGAVGSVGMGGWLLLAAAVFVVGILASVAAMVFTGKVWLFPLLFLCDLAAVAFVIARAMQTRKALHWVQTAAVS